MCKCWGLKALIMCTASKMQRKFTAELKILACFGYKFLNNLIYGSRCFDVLLCICRRFGFKWITPEVLINRLLVPRKEHTVFFSISNPFIRNMVSNRFAPKKLWAHVLKKWETLNMQIYIFLKKPFFIVQCHRHR